MLTIIRKLKNIRKYYLKSKELAGYFEQWLYRKILVIKQTI